MTVARGVVEIEIVDWDGDLIFLSTAQILRFKSMSSPFDFFLTSIPRRAPTR